MFTFEDLAKLDPTGIQTLMRSAGNDRITVALKDASEQLRDLFFKNMSERAAKILRDDMQAMGRYGCAMSRRRSSSWSTWPRSSPPPAKSCWPMGKKMSWFTDGAAGTRPVHAREPRPWRPTSWAIDDAKGCQARKRGPSD